MAGACSAGPSGTALNSAGEMGRAAGAWLPQPSAPVTLWSLTSMALRRPFHSSQLPPAPSTSTARSSGNARARSPSVFTGPAIRLIPEAGVPSHTVQSASSGRQPSS